MYKICTKYEHYQHMFSLSSIIIKHTEKEGDQRLAFPRDFQESFRLVSLGFQVSSDSTSHQAGKKHAKPRLKVENNNVNISYHHHHHQLSSSSSVIIIINYHHHHHHHQCSASSSSSSSIIIIINHHNYHIHHHRRHHHHHNHHHQLSSSSIIIISHHHQ